MVRRKDFVGIILLAILSLVLFGCNEGASPYGQEFNRVNALTEQGLDMSQGQFDDVMDFGLEIEFFSDTILEWEYSVENGKPTAQIKRNNRQMIDNHRAREVMERALANLNIDNMTEEEIISVIVQRVGVQLEEIRRLNLNITFANGRNIVIIKSNEINAQF